MSIKRNITVQDPEYLLCNRCDEQDREWFKNRQRIVAVLDAIKGSPKMKQYILHFDGEAKLPWDDIWYYKWYFGRTLSNMIKDVNACDTMTLLSNIEECIIKYDAIAELRARGYTLTEPYDEESREREQKEYVIQQQKSKKLIQSRIESQRYYNVIEQLLEMLSKESGDKLGIKAPYTYRLRHNKDAVEYGSMKGSVERCTYIRTRNNGYSTKEQIEDLCKKTTSIQKVRLRNDSWSQDEIVNTTVKEWYEIEEYPDVLITMMDCSDAKDDKKNWTITETEFQLGRSSKVIKYRLVSVVTKDISTGEIYAEERCNDDNWIGNAINSERYKFEEKSDTKLRLMAIYELERD